MRTRRCSPSCWRLRPQTGRGWAARGQSSSKAQVAVRSQAAWPASPPGRPSSPGSPESPAATFPVLPGQLCTGQALVVAVRPRVWRLWAQEPRGAADLHTFDACVTLTSLHSELTALPRARGGPGPLPRELLASGERRDRGSDVETLTVGETGAKQGSMACLPPVTQPTARSTPQHMPCPTRGCALGAVRFCLVTDDM